MLLLVFGGAGAAGTVVAGWAGPRPAILALIAAGGIVVSQALMALGAALPPFAWLEMIIWGAPISALIIGLQGWVLELASEQPDAGSALYVAAFNLGIGAGAMIGGLALEAESERAVLWTGIVLGGMAGAALALPARRSVRSALEVGDWQKQATGRARSRSPVFTAGPDTEERRSTWTNERSEG